MHIIKTVLIDDDPVARLHVESLVSDIDVFRVLGSFPCTDHALELVTSREVDLIISGIQMSGMDGISFLKSLERPPLVIFITSYPEYATEGFELDVIDFILKSMLSRDRLLKAVIKVQRAMFYRQIDGMKYFKYKDRGHTVFIVIHEILYVEAWGDYARIYTVTGMAPHILLGKMKDIEEQLSWRTFVRVHRSFIVNMDHIVSMNAVKVVLKNHKEINIGMQYRAQLYARMGIKQIRHWSGNLINLP